MLISIVTLVALLASGSGNGPGEDFDSLLKDMRRVARRTYQIYNDMNISGTLTRDRSGRERREYAINYSGNGLLQAYQFSIIEEIDGEKSYLDREILSASPTDHLVLRRQSPDSVYYLESAEAQGDDFFELTNVRRQCVMSPCFVGPYSLPKLLESPYFRIKRVERVERDGHKLLKIHFNVDPPEDYTRKMVDEIRTNARSNSWSEDRLMLPGPVTASSGWMVLDPEHGYIVYESEVESKLPNSNTVRKGTSTIEYLDGPKAPVPRLVIVPNRGGGSTFTMKSYDFQTLPPSHFTLARLGLGDFPAKKRPVNRMYYVYAGVLTISVVGLLLAFLLTRKKKPKGGARGIPLA